MYKAEYLEQILQLCKVNNVICIADEVMTGFGKLGENFASDYIETKPDIISLSKALTAGVVPMAVTSCTSDIYNAFLSDSIDNAFFHAHTYTANPIACSAAIAGIELLNSKDIKDNIKRIINSHQSFNERIKNHPKVESTRQLGVIFALDLNIDMDRYGSKRDDIQSSLMEKGVYLRPLGKTIYMVPAYIISKSHLDKIYSSIEEVLEEL
jgi:adenosylmethionine-8-amino-7-oxononanoate aminotransferase